MTTTATEGSKSLYVSTNTAGDCVGFASDEGFYVFHLDPFKKKIARQIAGGVKILALLDRTNMFGFVGKTDKGQYPNNKVIIWDDNVRAVSGSLTFQNEEILNLWLTIRYIITLTSKSIYVNELSSCKLVHKIDLVDSAVRHLSFYLDVPKGNLVVAYSTGMAGEVSLRYLTSTGVLEKELRIKAHDNQLQYFVLSSDGRYISTASVRGTILRIFDTTTSERFAEFRRGSDVATITDMRLSRDNTYLIASSSKGTVHVFNTGITTVDKHQNQKMESYGLYYIRDYLPSYWQSTWSFCQIYTTETNSLNLASPVITGEEGHSYFYVVGHSGNFYKIDVDEGGKPTIVKTIKYLSEEHDPFNPNGTTIK